MSYPFFLWLGAVPGTSYLEVIKRVICWSLEHGRSTKWIQRCCFHRSALFFLGEHKVPLLYVTFAWQDFWQLIFFSDDKTCIQPLRQKVEDHCGCFCLSTGLTIPSAGRISIFSTTLHDLFVDRRAPECGWPETGHENFWTRTRHLAARQTGWRSLSGGHCTYWQRRPSAYAERAEQLASHSYRSRWPPRGGILGEIIGNILKHHGILVVRILRSLWFMVNGLVNPC